MLQKFKTYYQKNELFNPSDKILLAVSGGKDSMVMLHLFNSENLNFGVAHCNFNLRGSESDADEELVKSVCEKLNIPFYSNSFDTQKHAQEKGISIQMAAREMRYQWFQELSTEFNYQYIATAHHKNDVAETMLINLTNGTGLAGLHGIRNKSGKIIRPLLDFTREEIEAYVLQNKVVYREDQSNADNKYTRNSIRLDVIPLLEQINPNLIESLNKTANYLAQAELILEEKVSEELNRCSVRNGNKIYFDIGKIKELTALETQLYYFFKPYGFNAADIENIISSLNEQSGKIFYSKSHQLIKDRDYLIIHKKNKEEQEILVFNNMEELEDYGKWEVKKYEYTPQFTIRKSNSFANLDADKIEFPLTLRYWKEGDVFQPLGMNGNKKVSDFFIDQKVDVLTKRTIKILAQNNQIIWIEGFRIDEQFKITNQTKNVLLINSSPKDF
ncbi:MAG: tRNA lysidine(34) synthetase TilS [Flavobacteriales bacterium]|nr:tRNA lysidine(34) synthetase TilS [Flavobacteriales bacterium]